MNEPRMLIDVQEASVIIMNFIGTEKFNNVIGSLEDNARAGFTAGLSFALCLIMSEAAAFLHNGS